MYGCGHATPWGESMKSRYQNRIELLQGTLDLLILQTLQWGALHRLERQKWIAAAWKVSENKQRVRVYRLTAAGKRQLLSERSRWEQLSEAIAGILNPARENQA